MSKAKAYLAGSITGLLDNFNEAEFWRSDFKSFIEEINPRWSVFNPVEHLIWDGDKLDDSVDGGMTLDLWHLTRSSVIIADLRYPSIGTDMELAVAREHHVPVIGFIDNTINKEEIHPWIKNCCMQICDDVEDAKLYFVDHFINEI